MKPNDPAKADNQLPLCKYLGSGVSADYNQFPTNWTKIIRSLPELVFFVYF
jgi:hypothetical protein